MRVLAIALAAGLLTLLGLLLGLAVLVAAISGEASGGCQASGPSADGEPPLIQYYIDAAARYSLGPDGYAYLGAINEVETKFGTDLAVSSAGAIGWMQFEPGTWARYAVSVTDPSAPADPGDPQDAIYTAARYLAASGAPGNWPAAIFAYNHAGWYVAEVQSYALRYSGPAGLRLLAQDIAAVWGGQQPAIPATAGTTVLASYHPTTSTSGTSAAAARSAVGCSGVGPIDVAPVPGRVAVIMPNGLARPPADAPVAVQAMVAAGDRIVDFPYSWGGGHCVAAMNQQQPDPQACPGSQENGGPGYDCSSSTSYVLWGGGQAALLGEQPQTSGALAGIGAAGVGRWVTWMANAGHVYIEVAGIWLNTENGPWLHSPPQPPAAPSATGPRWSTGNTLDSLTRTGYVPRHPPGL
ncbi:lytic transglycosylase domain-containing protein [Conexibacter sp. DBS9H8]|uniref:lytic transglycosylase domain-containing protein n=1 Tax=Conexibacter sp. DBS9H8 TaxID=2937801 RepID=UPI00200BD906|nr:lytic transglycosylase domain-containing protein [Conexibacter sp. DBS9H8]